MIRSISRIGLIASLAFVAMAAQADKLRLENGDIVSGEIAETTDAGVVLDHPVMGRLTIAADQIDAHVEGNAALPAPPVPPPPPRPGIAGTRLLEGWKKQLQFGLTGSSGNSDNQDFLAGVRGNFADEAKRWQFDSGYYRSSTSGAETKNQAFVMLLRDFLFSGEKYFCVYIRALRLRSVPRLGPPPQRRRWRRLLVHR